MRGMRLLITAAVAAILAACSLLHAPGGKAPPPVAVVVLPTDPIAHATQRFEIDTDKDDLVGVVQITKASKEDTLPDIARRFNVGYEEIVRANPKVDPWLPGDGRDIIVPTQFILPNAPHEGIVVNIAAMRAYYFPKVDKSIAKYAGSARQVVYTFPIGIGKVGWSTPEGSTKVVRKVKDPTWIPGPGVRAEHKENGEILPAVVPPGPDNPLGNRAMYLGWSQFLIHGTNKPYGVGLRSSHGCMRLYPEDIEVLYDMVGVGEKVTVVNQPFLFGWHENQLYLQTYGILEDDPRDWQKAQKRLLTKALAERIQRDLKARGEQVNWDAVSKLAHDPRGLPVPISAGEASVERVIASAQRVQNHLPAGSTWDGISNLPMDEQAFQKLAADRDPNAPAVVPAPAASGVVPARTPAPAPAQAVTPARKTGG